MSEYGYIPEAPTQSWGSNKGIFTPNDIYNLDLAGKFTTVGSLELISTQTVSGASSVAFDDVFGNYAIHFLTFTNMTRSGGASNYAGMEFSADGGSSFAGSYPQALEMAEGTTFYDIKTANYGSVRLGQHGDTEPSNGYCYIYDFIYSSKYTFVTQQSTNSPNSGTNGMVYGGHCHTTAQANNYFKIEAQTGSGITISGIFSLYGLRTK